MRIISGYLKGKTVKTPDTDKTHPMGEKVRGALFNILGDITGLTVLDAFAGSGAIGFEALSRGAQAVTAIETDLKAYEILKQNSVTLDAGDSFKCIHTSCLLWSQNNPNEQFSIVICDPPYDKISEDAVTQLSTHVQSKGIMVLSWPSDRTAPEITHSELLTEKVYAGAKLIFYRKH